MSTTISSLHERPRPRITRRMRLALGGVAAAVALGGGITLAATSGDDRAQSVSQAPPAAVGSEAADRGSKLTPSQASDAFHHRL